jgi:PKD repeat protein
VFSNEQATTQFIASPSSGSAPLEVTFDASDSVDEDGNIVEYAWDFDEDGFYDDAEGINVKYIYTKVGTYTAKLRVTDNNNQSSFAEQEISVEAGENPIAVITVNSEDGVFYIGKSYVFDGNKSSSPNDSKITKYLWDFGDGSIANTRTANHSFSTSATYSVKLTVTDQNNLKGENVFDIKIEAPKTAPTALITPTPNFSDKDNTYIEGTAPFEVSFSALGSSDPDDNIVDYKWDFDGDGTSDDTGDIVSYIFQSAGEYNVILTVIDSDENQSSDSMIVKVKPHGLKALLVANPVEGEVPLKVNFDASGSSYPEAKIISYEWDFGDGSAKRIDISQITYKYNAVGTFTAKVKVLASDGSSAESSVTISVRSLSIKACFSMKPEIGEAPLEVAFDPSCSTGSVVRYRWDFGNGKTSTQRKPETVYSNPGNYEVSLEVMDSTGITNTVTQDIVVTGVVE